MWTKNFIFFLNFLTNSPINFAKTEVVFVILVNWRKLNWILWKNSEKIPTIFLLFIFKLQFCYLRPYNVVINSDL